MGKFWVPIFGSAGKKALIDTDPPGKAVLGKNIYASDGVTLLQDLDILNSPSTPPIATAQTTAIKSNASTQAKGLVPFGGGGGGGGGGGAINTDGLPEGVVNKYFTNRRAQDAVGAAMYCVASGTNTYTGTLSPVPTAYDTNDTYVVKFTNACTGASTLNLNSLGAKAIQLNGAALTTGQIPANSTLDLLYDGTQFQIVGLIGGASPLTTKGDLFGHSTVDARIPVGTDAQVLTADSTQALGVKWAAVASVDPSFFGDGSDGNVSLDGTVAAPTGMTKNGSIYTLTKDFNCANLTPTGTALINCNNFRLFVSGIADVSNAAAATLIVSSVTGSGALNGTNATGTNGYSRGYGGSTVSANGSIGFPANAGAFGVSGITGAGLMGYAGSGSAATYTIGGSSSYGGAGGSGVSGAGGASRAGITIASSNRDDTPRVPTELMLMSIVGGNGAHKYGNGASAPGGSGGSGDGVNKGGGGGGGGAANGVMYVAIRTLAKGTASINIANVNGGNGGNGGTCTTGNCGGGGGGGAGGGGTLRMIIGNVTGTGVCTVTANGGNGGTGGTKIGTGVNGSGAPGAQSGSVIVSILSTNTLTFAALVAGAAGGGVGVTTAGAGGVASVTV